MHMMGFKIVNTYQEMTRKQKLFFQLMIKELNKDRAVESNEKDKAMEIIERSRNGTIN
jgi:hypothetical protein